VNQSISDAAWGKFTTNGFVAIPHHEAAEFGLPLAEDFPDDPSKGVYVLEAFHEIHCVVSGVLCVKFWDGMTLTAPTDVPKRYDPGPIGGEVCGR
jgi:hypothetical protein